MTKKTDKQVLFTGCNTPEEAASALEGAHKLAAMGKHGAELVGTTSAHTILDLNETLPSLNLVVAAMVIVDEFKIYFKQNPELAKAATPFIRKAVKACRTHLHEDVEAQHAAEGDDLIAAIKNLLGEDVEVGIIDGRPNEERSTKLLN